MDFASPVLVPGTGTGRASLVMIDDTVPIAHPGLPRVPVRVTTIELPAGTTVKSVRAFHSAPTAILINDPIETEPPVYPIDHNDQLLDSPLETYYDGKMFPADWFTYDVGRGLNDDGTPTIFINIYAYPVRVETTSDGQIIWSIDTLNIEVEHTPPSQAPESKGRAEHYDMVIIGPEKFKGSLQVLANHKDATGLRSRVVTLGEIYQGLIFQTKGRDNPEMIKYFIKDAIEAWGIEYVLLGGDIDVFPGRHIRVVDGYDDDAALKLDGQWVLTDIYFGDIYNGNNAFSSWDENSNGTFGEWLGGRNGAAADDPDFYMDVYVGRLPASTIQEMDDMVDKVITYENNTEWAWYWDATVAGCNLFDPPVDPQNISEGEYSGELLAASLEAKGYTVKRLYESKGNLTTWWLNHEMNGGLGLISMIGHGTYTMWGTNTSIYYQNSNIKTLINGALLPVGSQASCLTGAFDNGATGKYPGPQNVDSMSEEFVKAPAGGHIANLGYSRVAYGGKGTDHPNVTSGYMNQALFDILSSGPMTPGKALSDARNDCINNLGVSFVGDYKHMAAFHLMGDPSVALGGVGLRVEANRPNMTLLPGGSTKSIITVTNIGAYETIAHIQTMGEGAGWTTKIDNMSLSLLPGEHRNATLTISVDGTALAGEQVVIEVWAASDANLRSAYGAVKATVDQVHSIDVTVTEPNVTTLPGQAQTFKISAQDQGNGPDAVTLGLTGLPTGWAAQFGATSMALTTGGTNWTNLTVTLPATVVVGRYDFELTFKNPSLTVTGTKPLSITVSAISGINISRIDPNVPVFPGESTIITVQVHNEGNHDAQLSLNISTPTTWNAVLDNASFTLPPYSYRTVSIALTVGSMAINTTHLLPVTILSEGSALIWDLDVTVKRVWGLQIGHSPMTTPVVDGENATLGLLLNNTGNAPEFVDLEALDVPTGWEVQFDREFTLYFPPHMVVNVPVTINTIIRSAPGPYNILVHATTLDSRLLEDTIVITVAERPEVSITLLDPDVKTTPGSNIENKMTFENNGNMKETFSLGTSSSGGLTLFLPSGYHSVLPGQSINLSFNIIAPADARSGVHYYSILLTRVIGPSLTLGGNLTVEQIFGHSVKVAPISARTWSITIMNLGNGNDTFNIRSLGAIASWTSLSNNIVVLGPGEKVDVQLKFSPSKSASPGTYYMTVKVTSSSGNFEEKDVHFEVEDTSQMSALGPGAIAAWALVLIVVVFLVFWFSMRRAMGARYTDDEEQGDEEETNERAYPDDAHQGEE